MMCTYVGEVVELEWLEIDKNKSLIQIITFKVVTGSLLALKPFISVKLHIQQTR